MPFPFKLPTTSSLSFSTYFESNSHPSLPLAASTYRGVVRDSLKKYKHLPPQSQATELSSLLQCLNNYLPSLFAVDAGFSGQSVAGEEVDIVLKTTPAVEWRPTLSTFSVPGREPPRTKLNSLEYEIYFMLSTLAYIHTLLSRNSLHPLYSTSTFAPSSERTTAITAATKHLLSAASIHNFLSSRSEALPSPSPCADISTPVFTGLAALALAEATLLAVLKDDPYSAAVAQDRNKNDKEWMIKAPEIPKVRTHLFARLCLAATEHAAKAAGLLRGAKIEDDLVRYVEDLKRAGKAKACRFLGIDAELGGQTGTGIAWLRAGMQELGVATAKAEDGKRGIGLGLGRLKKEWSERREERKVDKGAAWGVDAGVAEEGRVLAMLEAKWVKMNDTINTQPIPPIHPLLAAMPSGRDMHIIAPYHPPTLDASALQAMRAPPSLPSSPKLLSEGSLEAVSGLSLLETAGGADESHDSSDDGDGDESRVVGAFPGTERLYGGVRAGGGGSGSGSGSGSGRVNTSGNAYY